VKYVTNLDRIRMFAKELVDLQPDVILANSTPVTAVLQRIAGIAPPTRERRQIPGLSLSSPSRGCTSFIPTKTHAPQPKDRRSCRAEAARGRSGLGGVGRGGSRAHILLPVQR